MYGRLRILAVALAFSVAAVGCTPREEPANERWATTEDVNIAIDWDKVNEAYKLAEGPEDLEKRINEIYQGEEVISIAVADLDDKTQEVTGFFDKDSSGKVDEGEKVFTIKREITGEGTAQVQTAGHGMYAGYHSPMMSIATGMLLGSMMSNMFSPGYSPMYRQPYVTSPSRTADLRSSRSARPARATPSAKPSGSGRAYNSRPRPRVGGGRFGIRRGVRAARPVRLDA